MKRLELSACAFAVVLASACGPSNEVPPSSDVAVDLATDAGHEDLGEACEETAPGLCAPAPPETIECDGPSDPDGPCLPRFDVVAEDCPNPMLAYEDRGICGADAPTIDDWECSGEHTPGLLRYLDTETGNTLPNLNEFLICDIPTQASCPDRQFADPATLGEYGTTVVYVDPAAVGGDGSLAAPFATIDAALAASPDVVGLSRGDHAVSQVAIDAEVAIVGNCVGNTVVTGSDSLSTFFTNAPTTFRDLTIRGVGPAIVAASTRVTVDHVLLDGAGGVAIATDDVDVDLQDVWITSTTPAQAGPGIGVQAQRSRINASRVLVDRNIAAGILLIDGTTMDGDSVVVRQTYAGLPDVTSGGIVVDESSLTLRQFAVDYSQSWGIVASGAGSKLDLAEGGVTRTQNTALDDGGGLFLTDGSFDLSRVTVDQNNYLGALFIDSPRTALVDVMVSNTHIDLDSRQDEFGGGVVALDSVIAVERTVFDRNQTVGLLVTGGSLVASDLVVLNTVSEITRDIGGTAINVFGAAMTLDRVLLTFNRLIGLGFNAGTTNAEANVRDLVVRSTRPQEQDGRLGLGATFAGGATLERVLLSGNRAVGLNVIGETTTVVGTDLVIEATTPDDITPSFSAGIAIDEAGSFEGTRVVVRDNGYAGLIAAPSSHAIIRDLTVSGHGLTGNLDSVAGMGLIGIDSVLELQRAQIIDNDGYGVAVFGAEGRLTATDLRVAAIAGSNCDGDACDGVAAGIGIAAVAGAHADIERFTIRDAALAGLMLATETTSSAAEGVIESNRIGINVQGEHDLDSTFNRVLLRDNLRDQDTSSFAVPNPTALIASE